MLRSITAVFPRSVPVPLPVSSRCGPEPTALQAFPSACTAARRCCYGLIATVAGIIWGIVGDACPAAAAELDAPITATWSGIGLREWAGRVSETAGLPVLVDRRLDPDTAIRLECRGEPLLDVLERGATIAGGEVAVLKSSIRIVPRGEAAIVIRAEAARQSQVASLPPRQRAVLNTARLLSWPAGARPRDLLAATTAQAGIAVTGIDTVPHDHLPAMSLPEMTLAERLDLLLAAFDLRVDWQAAPAKAGGQSSPIATGMIIAIDAGLPPATRGGETTAAKLPGRRPSPKPTPAADQHTFSLKVAAPLEELLAAIAVRLGLTLDLDRESLKRAGIAQTEIVRASVKDASRDQLLDDILDPLALDWTINNGTLRVFAVPKP
jgi:hypothetical protein